MFGLFSSPKIILLLLVVGVVWWLVRRGSIANRENHGNSPHDARSKTRSRPGASGAESKEKGRPIEDMVPCPKCGAYVAKNAGHDCVQ